MIPANTKSQLKRQHSAEPITRTSLPDDRGASGSPISGTPNAGTDSPGDASTGSKQAVPDLGTEGSVGSPFKKHRASLPGFDESVRKSLGATLASAAAQGKERGNSEGSIAPPPPSKLMESRMEEDEEL